MGKKYYAVRAGRVRGIYDSWAACERQRLWWSCLQIVYVKTGGGSLHAGRHCTD